jgi:hypothetical protein
MDAITLYVMGICVGFTADSRPCGAHLYQLYDPDRVYWLTKAGCLSRARRLETKDPARYKVYCVGKDGVSLDSHGRPVDPKTYFEAVDRWYSRPDLDKLTSQQVFEIRW